MLSKLINYKWVLRNIFQTIWFNFHYLPFKQAIKLPIVLYKPRIIAAKGKIKINGAVRPFMIQLGRPNIYIYKNEGVMFENWGGVKSCLDIPVDSRPPIPVILGHLVIDFVRRYD